MTVDSALPTGPPGVPGSVRAELAARLGRALPPGFADAVAVWLLAGDGEDAVYVLAAHHAEDPELGEAIVAAHDAAPPLRRSEGFLGLAATSRRAVVRAGGPAADGVDEGYRVLMTRWPVGALAAVPLRNREDVAGVMTLTRIEGRSPFSDADVRYLEHLAEWLSLALENASLLEAAHAARRAAEDSQARSHALLAHATDMVLILDGDGRAVWASPAAARSLGWDSAEDFLASAGLDAIHPDDREHVEQRVAAWLAGDGLGRLEAFRVQSRDGSWRWVEATASDARDDPAVGGLVLNARDTTEEVVSRSEAEEHKRGQQEVLDSIPMSTAVLDAEGTVVTVNRAWRGFAADNGGDPGRCGIGQSFLAVCEGAGDPMSLEVAEAVRAVLSGALRGYTGTLPCHSVTDERWYQIQVAPLAAGTGRAVVYYVDVSESKRYAALMAHRAAHDYLTGLPNRVALVPALREAVEAHRGRESGLAVLFCDLDQFKLVNDTFGHEVGDELLVAVAHRLRAIAGDRHIVARFAGDEFVIVCRDLEGAAEAIGLAEKVGSAMAEPFQVTGRTLSLSTSVGIALGSDRAVSSDLLLRDADAALYEAKARGRARYAVFDDTLRGRSERRLDLMQALPHALLAGELSVHFQPLVDLLTFVPYGAEALLRWERPGHGPISPWEFIPVAEENGFILELGRWVLEQACRAAADWQHLAAVQVSVNLSARQIVADDIVAVVQEVLAGTGLPAAQLCLEITESQLMGDPDRARRALTALRQLGVTLAMDDFGTGYSSLSYLKRLPVQVLKIDRDFVDGVASDPDDAGIVGAVTGLARALDLHTVA